MIHVCSLARLHETIERTGATHVITCLRRPEQARLEGRIARQNHLILSMDDIAIPLDGYAAPADEHVARLVDFVSGWDRSAPLVVHCFAGISRSSATAYVAACALNPARDEMQIARNLRRASRIAMPNTRIVSLADRLLRRDGRMVRAIDAIGPGFAATEGEPFQIELV